MKKILIVLFFLSITFGSATIQKAHADTASTFQIYALDQTGKGYDGLSINVTDNGGGVKTYTSSGGGAILIPTFIGHTISFAVNTPPFGLLTVSPMQFTSTVYDYNSGTAGCGELKNSCIIRVQTTTATKFQTYVLNQSGGQGIDGVTLSITDKSPAGASKTYSRTSAGGGAIIIDTYIGDSITETVTAATQLSASSISPQAITAIVYDYNNTSKPSCGELSNSCIFFGNIPIVSLTLVLGLPGIGYNGPAGVTPQHNTRPVVVQLYDASVPHPSDPGTNPLVQTNGTVTFDNGNDTNAGYFVGTINNIKLPTNPPANNQYKILVQVPQYLYQLAVNPNATDSNSKNIFTTTGGSITTSPFPLVSGDVYIASGGVNHLNLDDYNQILTCFNNLSDGTCNKTTNGINFADLDDDGKIDIVDLNLYLRSLFQLQQSQAPGCSSGDCTGD